MKDKETYPFKKPQDFRTIRFHLTAEAIEWLAGTTNDNGGNTIGNHALFYDLLARMRSLPGRDGSFRRPQELQAGQVRFSETGLAEEWHMGRKKVRNLLATMERPGLITASSTKVASVASLSCVEGWTDMLGCYVENPCNTAQTAFERLLNGIYPAVEARCGENKNVFQFRDMPRSNLPSVGHSLALSRLTGSSPVAALAGSHLIYNPF